jgi:adenine-specific DNA-methyltransferase
MDLPAGQAARVYLGAWPAREVSAPRRALDHYATKDRAMAEVADYGLMVWDGKSRGTLTNTVNLCRIGKIAVVWVAPVRAFQTVRSRHDLETLGAAGCRVAGPLRPGCPPRRTPCR